MKIDYERYEQIYKERAQEKLPGEQILGAWSQWQPFFVRVMPKDYERVLAAQRAMREAGLSPEEAEMAAFEQNSKNAARLGGK